MDASNFTVNDFALWVRQQNEMMNVKQWEQTALAFGIIYVILGCLAISINSVFLHCILRKRSSTFSHVFYIMILNFTVIDIMKGICSILYALKLLKSDMSGETAWWTVKVDQYSGMLLRFCNLATIINLSMITLNEYIFIRHPLRYASLVTRARVVGLVTGGWMLSLTVTLANSWAMSSSRSIMIDQNCLANGTSNSCIRHTRPSQSMHVFYHLSIIAFCLICLVLTACCYLILLRIITTLIKEDRSQCVPLDNSKGDCSNPKANLQVMRRHKYLVVIGSVICVYTVYLITYAIIQAIQVASITSRSSSRDLVNVKYVCYLFISLHSLLQPLCYLRMTEFRQLLFRGLCGRRRRGSVLTEHYFVSSRRDREENGNAAQV